MLFCADRKNKNINILVIVFMALGVLFSAQIPCFSVNKVQFQHNIVKHYNKNIPSILKKDSIQESSKKFEQNISSSNVLFISDKYFIYGIGDKILASDNIEILNKLITTEKYENNNFDNKNIIGIASDFYYYKDNDNKIYKIDGEPVYKIGQGTNMPNNIIATFEKGYYYFDNDVLYKYEGDKQPPENKIDKRYGQYWKYDISTQKYVRLNTDETNALPSQKNIDKSNNSASSSQSDRNEIYYEHISAEKFDEINKQYDLQHENLLAQTAEHPSSSGGKINSVPTSKQIKINKSESSKKIKLQDKDKGTKIYTGGVQPVDSDKNIKYPILPLLSFILFGSGIGVFISGVVFSGYTLIKM